jgi:hypothetical protein
MTAQSGERWASKGLFLLGTDGSNPSPSTAESVANLGVPSAPTVRPLEPQK